MSDQAELKRLAGVQSIEGLGEVMEYADEESLMALEDLIQGGSRE